MTGLSVEAVLILTVMLATLSAFVVATILYTREMARQRKAMQLIRDEIRAAVMAALDQQRRALLDTVQVREEHVLPLLAQVALDATGARLEVRDVLAVRDAPVPAMVASASAADADCGAGVHPQRGRVHRSRARPGAAGERRAGLQRLAGQLVAGDRRGAAAGVARAGGALWRAGGATDASAVAGLGRAGGSGSGRGQRVIGYALMAAAGALTPVGAALWLRLYAPETAAQPTPAVRRAGASALAAAGVFAAGCAGLAAKDTPGVLLATVAGALLYGDLLHRHLSLPLQALALLLALARLGRMPPAATHVRLVAGAGLGLLCLLLATADRRAGLGDVSVMALVGLVAGPNAPVVVIGGMLPPLLLVAARRVGARDPQPLAGWLLVALLLTAPWTWRPA
ncbi:MAG: hypothetical protein M5R40_07330 [Anaerolineae bacterium]|nr:hypothetical protein [Anaerolineae bacterium]